MLAYANQHKLSSLWKNTQELDSDRGKAIAKWDQLRGLLAKAKKKFEVVERDCREKDQRITELSGEVDILHTNQAKELIEEVSTTKADGAIW